MTFLRVYELTAKDGGHDAMGEALLSLATNVRTLDGCELVEIVHDRDQPLRWLLIERWSDYVAWQAGSLPKPLLARILELSATPPAAFGAAVVHTL